MACLTKSRMKFDDLWSEQTIINVIFGTRCFELCLFSFGPYGNTMWYLPLNPVEFVK